ncbi:protein CEPU-1-like [Mytilus trossulus]|uniref:protein CEPU-1-like n=1 Tax=Mytilus trossulus TaxID=6551 RepID=UPI0030063F95
MIYYLSITVLTILLYLESVTSTFPHQFDKYSTHNVTVTEGQQAILPCHVESNREIMIIWMNPKKIMISERESRYIDDPRISVERPFVGDYNLHIRNVRYDDRGEYTCNSNKQPVESRRIRLIVKVPSKFVRDEQRDEVITREGATVTLTCNATGIPTPNITWFRRESNEEEHPEQVGTVGEVLIIYNISRHCGGMYECMAFNGVYPAISKTIKVEVQFKPEITIRNKRLGQCESKETMLECIVTASPQGDNYWKRGQNEISKNEYGYRVEVYRENEYTVSISLRILNVKNDDFGLYTCEAKNALGMSRDTMELYEYVEPTKPPTTTTAVTTKHKKYNPRPDKNRHYNKQNNLDTEEDSLEYVDDVDYRKALSQNPRTQVSGQIGTGEYGNSVDKVRHHIGILTLTLILLKLVN